ncbi:MAG: methyltransferase family protein [Tsuneonella sp.]
MSAHPHSPGRPPSDVSPGVGLAGLFGLCLWLLVCRHWPAIADTLALPGPRARMDGAYAALATMLFTAGPMTAWSLLVDKVHRRASTGIDWTRRRPLAETIDDTTVKLAGLWLTWLTLAAAYCLFRWYWEGQYRFAMNVLGAAVVPLIVLSLPYVLWLDGYLSDRRDHAWHFGALVLGRAGCDLEEVKKHWRAWAIKGFFGAFMISILPPGFAQVVNADFAALASDPVQLGGALFAFLFVIDVQIGTVGYLLTMRPLDAHIRSGNPLLAGWLAALMCYPPFVFAFMGGNGMFAYEIDTPGWGHWLQWHPVLLWAWMAGLTLLTAIYAWATMAFGIRFSNLTYRGVLTNGPYRFTRHPAYLAKNAFWWATTLPFLVSTGDPLTAVRNTVFLGCVSAIYFWRAKTEEAHLLAEDAKYGAYHAWMAERGLVTAPLTRFARGLRRRRPALAAEPAE